jgi:hypothetical protein
MRMIVNKIQHMTVRTSVPASARSQSRTDTATSLVAVYKALGGGWNLPDGQPAAVAAGAK